MASPFDIYFFALETWKSYLVNRNCPDAIHKLSKSAEGFAAAIGSLEAEIQDQLHCFGSSYAQPWAIFSMIDAAEDSYMYLGMISTMIELQPPARDLAENYLTNIRRHHYQTMHLKPN
jgi:hypothetical protein